MTLEEAYKILGINYKNVSSDDLREYYQIRLKQVHGFNKDEQIRKITSAHQMIRNYRCSEDWVGSHSSPYPSNARASEPNSVKRSFGSRLLSFLNLFLKVCGVLFILLLIYAFIGK